MKKKDLAAQLLGKKGGKKTLKTYGKEHFKRMARLSWESRRAVDKPPIAKQAKVV